MYLFVFTFYKQSKALLLGHILYKFEQVYEVEEEGPQSSNRSMCGHIGHRCRQTDTTE